MNPGFFGGNPDFASDSDCIDEVAWALDPVRANRVVDPQLIDAISTVAPDFRPAPGSPLGGGFAVPPADGFFDPTARFVASLKLGLVGRQ